MTHRFYKKITSNFQYKITAFLLAFLFWYVVQGEEVLEVNSKIKIHIHPPKGFGVKGEMIRYKDATLKSSRVLLSSVSARIFNAHIYLSQTKAGLVKIRIGPEHIKNWNHKIGIVIYNPEEQIFLDQIYTKTVPVKENIQGLPLDGHTVEKIVAEPDHIMITGLKSEVKGLEKILTEPINIANISDSGAFETHVMPGDLSEMTYFSTEIVSVKIQVGEKKVNKKFTQIPVELQPEREGVHVHPKFVSIIIQGNQTLLNQLKDGDLRAYVDISDLPPGKHQKKVQIKIPYDTVLVEHIPEFMTVTIASHP